EHGVEPTRTFGQFTYGALGGGGVGQVGAHVIHPTVHTGCRRFAVEDERRAARGEDLPDGRGAQSRRSAADQNFHRASLLPIVPGAHPRPSCTVALGRRSASCNNRVVEQPSRVGTSTTSPP